MATLLNNDNDLLQNNPWTSTPDPYASAPATGTAAPPPADVPGWPSDPTDPAAGLPTTTTPTPTTAPAAPTYTQDLGTTGPAPPATAATGTTPYDAHLANINNATDPQTSAVASDALARQLTSDLEADGHVVKWQGDTLMIDGRPYEVGGQQPLVTGDPNADPTAPPDAAAPPATTGASAPAQPPGTFYNPATGQPGFVPNVPFTGNNHQQFVQGLIQQLGLVGHQSDTNPLALLAIVEGLNQNGVNASLDTRSDGLHKGIMLNGKFVKLLDGSDHWIWDEGGTGGGAPPPGALPPGALPPSHAPGGYDPRYAEILTWLKAHPGPDTTTGVTPPPGWGVDDVYGRLTADQPGDAGTANLVQSILAHPESLSDTDVERLKAQNAEEAAVAARSADEELQHFGYGSGLQDSPWLASQRATNAFNRRTSTIEGNRNLDITAANQRQSDRLKAAGVGSAFTAYKHSQRQAAVGAALDYIKSNFNVNIDMKKLSAQSEQFRADLMAKIAELQQADDQFRARYGLDAQELQRRREDDAFTHANTAAGR